VTPLTGRTIHLSGAGPWRRRPWSPLNNITGTAYLDDLTCLAGIAMITEIPITTEILCTYDALCFRQDRSFRDHRFREPDWPVFANPALRIL
jgi:hypothetical protein